VFLSRKQATQCGPEYGLRVKSVYIICIFNDTRKKYAMQSKCMQ
jgi:hypothetical protein